MACSPVQDSTSSAARCCTGSLKAPRPAGSSTNSVTAEFWSVVLTNTRPGCAGASRRTMRHGSGSRRHYRQRHLPCIDQPCERHVEWPTGTRRRQTVIAVALNEWILRCSLSDGEGLLPSLCSDE